MSEKLKVGILGATGMVGGYCSGKPEKRRQDLRGGCRRQMENGYSDAGGSKEAGCYGYPRG